MEKWMSFKSQSRFVTEKASKMFARTQCENVKSFFGSLFAYANCDDVLPVHICLVLILNYTVLPFVKHYE